MDGKWMARVLLDDIINGLHWITTIKSADDPQFSVWLACWVIIAIATILPIAPRILRNIRNHPFD
jgi:hypothetical protein